MIGITVDRSGNNAHLELSNIVATDRVLDSPTNNFAVFNSLIEQPSAGAVSYEQGNLVADINPASEGGNPINVFSTMPLSSGKWYCELIMFDGGTDVTDIHSALRYGVTADYPSHMVNDQDMIGEFANSYTKILNGGNSRSGGVNTSYGNAYEIGDIFQIALDLDNGKVWFGENNTYYESGDPAAGTNFAYENITASGFIVGITDWNRTSHAGEHAANFGQDSSFNALKTPQFNTDSNGIGDFFYAPPAGFLAMCTKNLPEPVVIPSNHFNTVLYNGDASEQAITGVGFQPDFVWVKHRQDGRSNGLVDAVRGATKVLVTDTTAVEATTAQSIKSFDVDGFTLGTDQGIFNESGGTPKHVSWNWKAGNANTAFSESGNNPAGTHRANVAAGFSIVSYVGTGATGTVAHGLGVAPEWIFIKNRDVNDPWAVYYGDNTDYLVLNTTAATADAATYFNDTSPTATVFTVSTAHSVNADAENYIAYCFHSVDGYSKVGSYTGNGVADGTFVYTGFRPAFVLTKVFNTADDWSIADTSRSPHNLAGESLRPNSNSAEDSAADIDILSNGFKVRAGDSHRINYNGDTYTYLAIAETPFKYSNAR